MQQTNSQQLKARSDLRPDVIVIGAGVLGCNTAWHLHQRGLKVLVLEAQAGPALQTTGAGAGFVCHWSRINTGYWGQPHWSMQEYGIDFYSRFAESCGRDIGFYHCGIAYIYTTEASWAKVQPRIEAARELGTELEILDERRAGELLPLIRFATTKGIIFEAAAVRVRTSDAIPALADQLAQAGVRFKYGTKVTGFEVNNGRLAAVQTTEGPYQSPQVVVTAGAWSRSLMHQFAIACPIEPVVQTRFTTPALPGVDATMPLLIFSDYHGMYIREERGGLLIGGSDDPPVASDRIADPLNPPDARDIVPDQGYRARDYLHGIEHVMPVLQQVEIKQIASGMPSFTPDRLFIADSVPDCEGLYLLAACNYSGITHGPALGRLITELVVDGQTTWERESFQLSRFSTSAASG